jgi:Flp pilus assembly protein TadD
MLFWTRSSQTLPVSRLACLAAATATAMMLGACANGSGDGDGPSALLNTPSLLSMTPGAQDEQVANAADPNAKPLTELEKATDYWGKTYRKDPTAAQPAINYAKNLKALGQKEQAINVLQAAHKYHPSNRQLNSEYGRLALEMDQYSAAQKLLEQADDPTHPDWRTISARGTVLAKQGKFSEAIPIFERALAASPGQPSVLNNLAIARAMDGQPEKAEALLRQAAADNTNDNPKIGQNLSLVLGLQGKYEEAKSTGKKALSDDSAAEDVSYVRQMVKLEQRDGAQRSAAASQSSLVGVGAGTGTGAGDLTSSKTKKIATGSTTKSQPKVPAGVSGLEAAAALAEADQKAKGFSNTLNDAYRPPAR